MHFADLLTKRISSTSSVCVGLDPRVEKLPEGVGAGIEGMVKFMKGIIDATADIASCVKPQLAFYEVLGWEGMKAFFEICSYAKGKGLIVIADGKRNDIGSTCDAYADAYLGKDSPIDALTVTPYLGSDGITPFTKRCTENGKGIFVLVKTSNPSSGEVQDMPIKSDVGDETIHEHIAHLVEGWGMHTLGPATNLSCIGAVVGATYPEELSYLRTVMPHIPFLIPGYGAQGGTAADAKRGFLPDGTGAIVNNSRGIIYASIKQDWQDAARKAVKEMAEALRF